MEIKTFGKLTEIVTTDIEIDFPLTLNALRRTFEQHFPELALIDYRIAINNQLIIDEDMVLSTPKVIALMPPFSGG